MRFQHIIIEGPDCSGKTTLFNKIHKETGYIYNIQDRSCMSMIVYSKLYDRGIESIWYDKLLKELNRLDILYIVLLPSEKTILERLKIRGDECQDENSILIVRKYYEDLLKSNLKYYPNVLLIESENLEENCQKSISFINSLNEIPTQELIKSLVIKSGKNELLDIKCKEKIDINNIDYTILNNPEKNKYYNQIIDKLSNRIFLERSGLSNSRKKNKLDNRNFSYSGNKNISFVHLLWRNQSLNVDVTLKQSNVLKDLWTDYEFLKILSVRAAGEISLPEDVDIELTINIRSAYIVP
jgi:thymidylate kinase